jgi:hypothetical protein
LLADESLIVAAESSLKIVTADHVQKALSRLQHLPYPWAISPFRSESDDVAVLDTVPRVTETKPAVRTTLPSAGETHRSVGVVEFGSPGIIEVGAPSVTPKSVSVPAEIEIPAAAVTFIDVGESSSTDEIRPADQVSAFVDEGVSHSENTHDRMPFLASTSATAIADQHTFEVGHRYIPDALECTDAVDMEDCSPSASHDSSDAPGVGDSESIWPVVSTHSLHGQSKSHTTATASLNLPDAAPIVEIHAVPVVEFVSGSTADSMQGSVEDSQTGSTRRPSESELSVRQPVFDRYTWIELGREVPAGTNSAALTGTMGTVADISSQNALRNLTTDFSATQSTTFDKIPMRHTSDSEILSSLTQHSANTDHGVFVMFNGHGLTRTSASEHVSTESSGAETARKSVHVSAVGDEQFGIRIHDKLAQVRSSILSSDSDEADGVADKEESSASWMDGKLIFGDTETSAVEAEAAIETDTSATMSDDDSAVDAGSVSLSFEAAKAARDEHGGASGETAEVAKLRRKFFSLPEDVKTIEWDLRSSLIGCDEVSPLANSLAALQHEVTSFQQGGRITGKTDAGPEAEAGSSTASPQTAADPQSLVGRARRRLDTSESDLRTVERDSSTRLPSAAVPNDLITAVTSVPDETSDETLRPYGASRASISKASASGMQVGRTAMVNESDSVMADNAAVASLPPVRGLGQLFTRLRQVRRESGENQ